MRYFIYCFRPNEYTVVVISAKLEVSCVNYKETEKIKGQFSCFRAEFAKHSVPFRHIPLMPIARI